MKKIIIIYFIFSLSLLSNSLFACTVFYAAEGNKILAGNNEDFLNAEAYIQFLPPKESKYGGIYFGFFYESGKMQPFGGVNEQGLFFDIASLNFVKLDKIPDGEIYKENLIEKIMEECSSVEEVIKLVDKYSNFLYATNAQIMFGDRFGNSVVFEGGNVLGKEGSYQIMTNFRQIKEDFNNGNIPCGRYEIANNLLKESQEISKDLFQNILESVHQEGPYSTVYSNIYDLKNGIIYLYYFHNFFDEVTLDISKELIKGERIVKLNSLFRRNFAAEGFIDWKNWELENRIKTRLAANIDPKMFEELAGKYKITFYPTNDSLKVLNENGKLYIVYQDTTKVEILPESNTKFFIATLNGDFEFNFTRNEAKQVIYLDVKMTELGNQVTYEKILSTDY